MVQNVEWSKKSIFCPHICSCLSTSVKILVLPKFLMGKYGQKIFDSHRISSMIFVGVGVKCHYTLNWLNNRCSGVIYVTVSGPKMSKKILKYHISAIKLLLFPQFCFVYGPNYINSLSLTLEFSFSRSFKHSYQYKLQL